MAFTSKNYSYSTVLNDQQLLELVKLRKQGFEYNYIAAQMNEMFGLKRTSSSYRKLFNSWHEVVSEDYEEENKGKKNYKPLDFIDITKNQHLRNTYSNALSDDQVIELIKMKDSSEYTWEEIALHLNNKYKISQSPNSYNHIWRNSETKVKKDFKEFFKKVGEEGLTREKIGDKKLKNKKNKSRFILTSAGVAQPLHEKGFKSLINMSNTLGAEIIVLPMRAHMRALQNQPKTYDKKLVDYVKKGVAKFATEFEINRRITALELQINPQQSNPITGINRIKGEINVDFEDMSDKEWDKYLSSHRKRSLIVAHSKQMLKMFPTGNESLPRAIASTGSITEASYLKDTRVGRIAKDDHVVGAILVEVEGDTFFMRQLQVNPRNGSVVSMGVRYFPNGKTKRERPLCVVGDLHPGEEHRHDIEEMKKLFNEVKPTEVYLHDWLGGESVNRHTVGKHLTRALMPEKFRDLSTEMDLAKKVIRDVYDSTPKDATLVMVPSNHPDFVTKYLDGGDYIKEPHNHEIAHRMVVEIYDGQDPIENRIDPEGLYIWPKVNQDIIKYGFQLNAHGHLGPNGSRGTPQSLENCMRKGISGHTHTPGIIHKWFTVGHMTKDRHGYNNGPSSWVRGLALAYPDGAAELVLFVNGKYKI